MNEYLDKAKQALADGLRVEIDHCRPGGSASWKGANDASDRADVANAAGHYVLTIYSDVTEASRLSSSSIDQSAARELMAIGAKYIGRDSLKPTDF